MTNEKFYTLLFQEKEEEVKAVLKELLEQRKIMLSLLEELKERVKDYPVLFAMIADNTNCICEQLKALETIFPEPQPEPEPEPTILKFSVGPGFVRSLDLKKVLGGSKGQIRVEKWTRTSTSPVFEFVGIYENLPFVNIEDIDQLRIYCDEVSINMYNNVTSLNLVEVEFSVTCKYNFISFQNCSNLIKLYLHEEPEPIFLQEYFTNTFRSCHFEKLPFNFFKNAIHAKSFLSTFEGCQWIKTKVPELWLDFPNAIGTSCYKGVVNSLNYTSIPANWK